jgi:D-arabinose 1-dehydrogenase-like Zn-dependent alcohol dehydrogenase
MDREKLKLMSRAIALDEAIAASDEVLKGRVRGRVVVDVNRLATA